MHTHRTRRTLVIASSLAALVGLGGGIALAVNGPAGAPHAHPKIRAAAANQGVDPSEQGDGVEPVGDIPEWVTVSEGASPDEDGTDS